MDDFDLTPPEMNEHDAAGADNAAKHRGRTIELMYRRYGRSPEGAVCADCRFLVRAGGGDGRFPKCKQFRVSSSAASDWRLRWHACGKFTKREDVKP